MTSTTRYENGTRRDPFAQPSGMEALAAQRQGKRSLRTRLVEAGPVRRIAALMRTRKSALPLSVALVFGAANLISYLRMPEYPSMDDGFVSFGWPFDVYLRGGFFTHEAISLTGLIGNIVVALCVIRLARKFLTKP